MSAACLKGFGRLLLSSTTFALIAGGGAASAQTLPLRGSEPDYSSPAGPTDSSPSGPPAQGAPAAASGPTVPALSGFQFNASVLASESYVSNAAGVSGSAMPDYMSTAGLSAALHDHTARVSLDATYNFTANYYDRGTLPTQFINNLQALGDLDVLPEYLDINMRAFAQPVVTSNFGALTADDRVVPGGYENSFGYFETPDLKFNLGDFASFKTMPSVGQVFFTTPPGISSSDTIPGIPSPENTTMRSVIEEISSGSDFTRLNWKVVGLFNETDSEEALLSEKSGVANGAYALNHEWSLLLTGGYDAFSDTIPLTHNVSGPVALGGFGITLGQDFSFKGEAGERYNSFSFNGNLRYDVSTTTLLTASANDYITTPEGQLLNNLTSLTTSSDGTLTSADDVMESGTASSLTSFSVQSPDNPILSQFVSRYQIVALSLLDEFPRTKTSISLFGTRMSILTADFPGSPVVESWGVRTDDSYNITPLLVATLGATYTKNQEFGGEASTILALGQLTYSLSRTTRVFLRANYLDRISSSSLIALSPLAGSLTDYQVTIGITHTL